MLELTDIQKSFGEHTVLSGVTLQLPEGVYWLKGVNGSGKSTLLKILGGLLPFQGDIKINGSLDIRLAPVGYRQLVSYAEAEPAYPSFLTGEEMAGFVTGIRGPGNAGGSIREELAIGDWLKNPIGSYSSGMLKKLSLLLAFSGNPRWILLDEPFTTLDMATQSSLCRLITARAAAGVSFLFTSHHDIEATEIAVTKTFIVADKTVKEVTSR